MILFIGWGNLVCGKEYYEKNSEIIDLITSSASLALVLSEEEITEEYPHDAIFNAALVGNNLFCNTRIISKHILALAQENGANIVHVNQGYTKCSTLVVDRDHIVTADRGIHKAAQAAGVDSLLISSGNVSLEPYEYGFIGGASGETDGTIYLCGSLENHPDGEKISEFIASCGKKCTFLPFDKLTDMGSIMFIK